MSDTASGLTVLSMRWSAEKHQKQQLIELLICLVEWGEKKHQQLHYTGSFEDILINESKNQAQTYVFHRNQVDGWMDS